ncbi:MAG: hypothetical protein IH989_02280 [Planctomycetes bacterium]|nr:hypothetical protein [Planctomycetota bacterium]
MRSGFAHGLRRRLLPAGFALAAVASATTEVHACAVCFGDPNSPMVKGAAAGVLVLVGVISFVLLGVAGTGMFWVHRSRRLARGVEEAKTESEGKGHPDS